MEVGAALAQSFPDGAWLVELAPLGNPSLVAAAIVFALQIQESPSRSAGEQHVSFLHNKALIFILDNCEHVVDEAVRVTEALLRGCPKVRIVATCREPLRVAGERVYRIPSLAVPSSAAPDISAADAAEYEAIALFNEALEKLHLVDAMREAATPAVLLTNTTAYLIALARYDEAETRARQALEIARDQQHSAAVAWTLQHLVAIATLRRADEDADG